MTTAYSVGHSTRSAEELVALLAEARIATLVDVRRYPGSRRNPQYNRDALAQSVSRAGIEYVWLGEGLGGASARASRSKSPRTAPGRCRRFAITQMRW